MLVYDVIQTVPCSEESEELPEDSGLHDHHGGRIERRKRFASGTGSSDAKYLVTVNADLNLETRYVVLAHELAHLFLSHLGKDDGAC